MQDAAAAARTLDSSPPRGDGTVHSAERSPTWNTPSSTRTLAQFSSPELPPLPSLPNFGGLQRESADGSASDDNFYTASWGSPYPLTPGRPHPIRREHTWADSSDNIENESPDPKFGLGHLLPTRLDLLQELSPTRPPTPASDRSSDHNRTPSGPVAFSRSALLRHLGSDSPLRSRATRSHRQSDSTLTVKPEDFHPKRKPHDRSSSMYQSRYAVTPPAAAEKDLPKLPKESPNADVTTPGLFDLASPMLPTMQRNSSTASVTLSMRPKKKVLYKGKNCIIGLPFDPPRGGEGNAPIPLTKEEVVARLNHFAKLGYDVEGFGHWKGSEQPFDLEHQAQARAIYPDSSEERDARQRISYRIKLPDTREWDEKETSKVEAALRELGVSGPDGQGEVENPMSRQASSHISSNPFSPPVRSASASSQPFLHMGSFPPSFAAASAPTSHAASIASPVSSMANVRPTAHLHRQSTFSPPLPQQMMPPPGLGGWSPQPMSQAQAMSSGGSPSLASTRPEPTNRQSPLIPVQSQPAQQFSFAQRDELVAQMHRQQQQQLQMQLQRQQEQQVLAARPPSTLQEVPEVENEPPAPPARPTLVRSGNTPEVVHPKPVHRHNISAQLEQDAENAHYRLEESMNKPLDEEDVDEHDRSDAAFDPLRSDMHQRIASLQKQMEGSDVETNPSDLDSVQQFSNANGLSKPAAFKFSRSWTDDSTLSPILPQGPPQNQQPVSKPVLPSLNVTAKEFNPSSATFNPGSFTGSSFSFHPQAQAKPFIPKFIANNHSTQSFVTSPGSSSFNPAAATFSPTGFSSFSFSTAPKEFTFNGQGPAFNPSARVFSPNSPGFSDNSIGSSGNSNSIFGNINIADIVKPAKKSKAVPIVAPKQLSPPRDEQEDEDGRIIQDDARLKRARHEDSDGDQVPQFAGPYSEDAAPVEPTRKDTLTTQIDESAASDYAEEVTHDISLLTQSTAADADDQERPSSSDALRHVFVFERPEKVTEEKLETEEPEEPEVSPLSDHDDSRRSSPAKRKTHQRSLSALAPEFKPRLQPEIDPDLNPYYASLLGVKESQIVEPIVSPPSSRRSSHTDVEPFQEQQTEEEEVTPPSQRVPSSVRYYDEQGEAGYGPSFEEIDTVMRHMNEEGSDAGVEREGPSWPASSPGGPITLTPGRVAENQRELQAKLRSDSPSPSPRRIYGPPAPLEGESDPFSDARAAASPPAEEEEEEARPERIISDWDDAVSEGRTEQFEDRSSFFDRRVSSLIDNAVRSRLGPLEKQLEAIHSSLASLDRSGSKRRPRSQPTVDSDADDEDDAIEIDAIARGWSPRRNGKFDKFRTIVQEALVAQQQSGLDDLNDALAGIKTTLTAISSLNADDLQDAVAHIKASVDDSVSQVLRLDDIQAIVEETVARQNSALIEQREQATRQEDSNRFSEFSDALRQAAVRLTEETEARKLSEKRRDETERLLKLTEDELTMFKESSRDVGQAATHIADQVHKATVRADEAEAKLADAEAEAKELRTDFSKVSTENAALMATLEEYRLSHDKWRKDIDRAYQDREAVMQTFTALRLQAEESIRLRETMRSRIDKVNADMSETAAQIANERAQWQKKETEYLTRVEVISARAEAEARTRERFEREMERLEIQEREAMRLRSALEQSKKDYAALEETANTLKLENSEHQKTADQYAREFREAREAGRIEVERTRRLLEADIDAANNQVNIVRAELEAEVTRARNELDHFKIDADTAKAKHELDLEQAADAKRDALHDALHSKNQALEEQKLASDERLEELRKQHRRDLDHVIENKNQAETFLKDTHAQKLQGILEQHRREMEQVVEGKMQAEKLLNDRVILSEDKVEYLQDKVLHLEEKLEVAKAAAHAAALAARSGKTPALERPISPVATRGPEKLNPQALRETIAVLQDQLQERESRIEALEQELSEIDKDAPNKLKAKETEIGWLRELLGVRIDDLGDLVTALSHPDFDRESVRNAAIRIKTGLQMEQHDKERLMSGSPQFPTLASISNFASPRAAQLAAAWGNWRKGRDLIPSSLSQSVQNLASSSGDSRDITPSKPPTTAQNFLTGLMTPPASNLRPSPEPESASSRTANGSIGRAISTDLKLSARALEKMPVAHEPVTPPLLHKASYDSDAVVDDGDYSTAGYYDDEESTIDGTPRGARRDSSFSGSARASTPRGPASRRQSSFGGSSHSTSPRLQRRGSFGPTMI